MDLRQLRDLPFIHNINFVHPSRAAFVRSRNQWCLASHSLTVSTGSSTDEQTRSVPTIRTCHHGSKVPCKPALVFKQHHNFKRHTRDNSRRWQCCHSQVVNQSAASRMDTRPARLRLTTTMFGFCGAQLDVWSALTALFAALTICLKIKPGNNQTNASVQVSFTRRNDDILHYDYQRHGLRYVLRSWSR